MKLKSILKNSPFGEVITKMADVWADPFSISLSKKLMSAADKAAVLVGTPCHHNLGDHLIASNEKKFLVEECHYTQVIEIPTRIFLHNREKIQESMRTDLPIFITGGGWMGDVWPEDQEIIEMIVSTFQKNDIIILPQTIYYSDLAKAKEAITKTNETFSKASSLTIFCRDQRSYDTAINNYSSVSRVFLCPDIGLYKPPVNHKKKSKIIRCCFRKDREVNIKNEVSQLIKDIASEYGYVIKEDSTLSKNAVCVWQRDIIIDSLINRFSDSAIIITDRLHGMIFSAIANTKCIAFDNKTHKVSGVFNLWLRNNPNIRLLTVSENQNFLKSEILDLLCLNTNTNYYSELKPLFTVMASEIMSIKSNREE